MIKSLKTLRASLLRAQLVHYQTGKMSEMISLSQLAFADSLHNSFPNQPTTRSTMHWKSEEQEASICSSSWYKLTFNPGTSPAHLVKSTLTCDKVGKGVKILPFTFRVNSDWRNWWRGIFKICTSSMVDSRFRAKVFWSGNNLWRSKMV